MSADFPQIIAALQRPDAYRHVISTGDAWQNKQSDAPEIEVHETHISCVILAGPYAFKLKKPIVNDFLDYGTLAKRLSACEEELRLGRRYGEDLYMAVLPISRDGESFVFSGEGEPVEYALQMRRFPSDALLSRQLALHRVTTQDMLQLASAIASLHDKAESYRGSPEQLADETLRQAMINFETIERAGGLTGGLTESAREQAEQLASWTRQFFEQHRERVISRVQRGMVRECHGDLHCGNVVKWRDHWMLFDGIEFNPALSWIDVLDDAAFLMVDLLARDQAKLANRFINAYLDSTGDYHDLALLRLFAVYRLMVRAKVAMIRVSQLPDDAPERGELLAEVESRIALAQSFVNRPAATLWITHGLSGSGKTTGTSDLIETRAAIRLRSDVERKRMFSLAVTDRPADRTQGSPDVITQDIYAADVTERVYGYLLETAMQILDAGFDCVVDATFLQRRYRRQFAERALARGHRFAIRSFNAEPEELKRRLRERQASGRDASDADVLVMERQMRMLEPLDDEERGFLTSG